MNLGCLLLAGHALLGCSVGDPLAPETARFGDYTVRTQSGDGGLEATLISSEEEVVATLTWQQESRALAFASAELSVDLDTSDYPAQGPTVDQMGELVWTLWSVASDPPEGDELDPYTYCGIWNSWYYLCGQSDGCGGTWFSLCHITAPYCSEWYQPNTGGSFLCS